MSKIPLRVGILGSGKIACDLLYKIIDSSILQCVKVMGRRPDSPGLYCASKLGIKVSTDEITSELLSRDVVDLVFDATSAASHIQHAPMLRSLGIQVIDLTPSNIGDHCFPAICSPDFVSKENISMVTCGGQVSLPIVEAIGSIQPLEYVEVVSSIAASTAGPATRRNVNEYLEITESALRKYSRGAAVKSILILNPAEPCSPMQTTIYLRTRQQPDMESISHIVQKRTEEIQNYAPGFRFVAAPTLREGIVTTLIRVEGAGKYLPKYAGNLDIITSAAVCIAEKIASERQSRNLVE